MKQKILFYVLFFNILVFLLLIGCEKSSKIPENNNKPYQIDVLKFGNHKVINLIVEGFQNRINKLYKENVSVRIVDGKFDAATISDLSARIVASDSDIAVSVTTPATALMMSANRGTKKQVFTFVSDLTAINYTGPGTLKNTCGISDTVNYKKTFELIKRLMPNAKNIGSVITKDESNALLILNGFKQISQDYGFEIFQAEIANIGDLHLAMKTLNPKVDLFLFGGDNNLAEVIDNMINLSESYNKPLFACDKLSIEAGAVAGYSVDYFKMGVRTAEICAFVKSDCKPEDIDVEKLVANELILNKKSASKYSIYFDEKLTRMAKEIIE